MFDSNFSELLHEELLSLKSNASMKMNVVANLESYNVYKDSWRVDGTDVEVSALNSESKATRIRTYFK